MIYDYVIIGGGAAGMCTAINLKKNNCSVLILEHNDRIGKKILSTGNGRCNLSNEFCKVESFKDNPEGIYPYFTKGKAGFIETVISNFDYKKAVFWFESIGLKTLSKNGLIYPITETATTVLDILRYRLEISGVDIINGIDVKTIKKESSVFIINNLYEGKNVVLCCGGSAAPKSGSSGVGFKLAKNFGHTIIKPLPALCGIKLKSDSFRIMQGVRTDCRLRLIDIPSKKVLIETKGNVQLNNYGISGIPAMNISGYISRLLDKGIKLKINIEFLPELGFENIVKHILNTFDSIDLKSRNNLSIDFVLTGLLNKKIAKAFLKEIGITPEESITTALKKFENSKEYNNGIYCGKYLDDLNLEKIFAARIAGVIKHFTAEIIGTNSFDEAQTTSGGVSTDEINPETMESKLVKGLFFAGEIIDVDGICGGYNLQWAWSSAMSVGGKNV